MCFSPSKPWTRDPAAVPPRLRGRPDTLAGGQPAPMAARAMFAMGIKYGTGDVIAQQAASGAGGEVNKDRAAYFWAFGTYYGLVNYTVFRALAYSPWPAAAWPKALFSAFMDGCVHVPLSFYPQFYFVREVVMCAADPPSPAPPVCLFTHQRRHRSAAPVPLQVRGAALGERALLGRHLQVPGEYRSGRRDQRGRLCSGRSHKLQVRAARLADALLLGVRSAVPDPCVMAARRTGCGGS